MGKLIAKLALCLLPFTYRRHERALDFVSQRYRDYICIPQNIVLDCDYVGVFYELTCRRNIGKTPLALTYVDGVC
jgi:hypothetical protein